VQHEVALELAEPPLVAEPLEESEQAMAQELASIGRDSPVKRTPALHATARGAPAIERRHGAFPASLTPPSSPDHPDTAGRSAEPRTGSASSSDGSHGAPARDGLPQPASDPDEPAANVHLPPITPDVIERPPEAEPLRPAATRTTLPGEGQAATPAVVAGPRATEGPAAVQPNLLSSSAGERASHPVMSLDQNGARLVDQHQTVEQAQPPEERQSSADAAGVGAPPVEARDARVPSGDRTDQAGMATASDGHEAATSSAASTSIPSAGRSPPPVSATPVVEQRQARRPATVGGPRSPRAAGEPAKPQPGPPTRAAEAAPETEELFAGAPDRSVGEWRRLLFEATSESPAQGRAAPRTPAASRTKGAPPEPALESTRRFLRPLVGVDPSTVKVYRGAAARQATESVGADALAAADAIAFPATHDERTPEGLGLLAHELTHVARQREPRFVPPVAGGTQPGIAGGSPEDWESPPSPAVGTPRVAGEPKHPSGEEAVAERVEGLVRSEAMAAGRRSSRVARPAEPASGPFSRRVPGAPSLGEPAKPDRYEMLDHPGGMAPPWGDLPAPWEPLPELPNAPIEAGDARSGSGAATAPTAIHRAATERSVEESSPGAAVAQAPASEPSPDVDALARQVYDVLKRRLAAERRREG
jgi:hypothetical protein